MHLSSGSNTWWYGRIANRQRSTDVAISSGRRPTESWKLWRRLSNDL